MNCLMCDHEAGHRYACHNCTEQMRRWLRELEDYAVIIAITAGPLRDQTIGSIGAAFGTRVPARDDAMVILDYRSGAGAGVRRLRDPRDMEDEPVRSLPGSVHGIACWLREERDETEPRQWTIASELRYLRATVEWCSIHQWVTELFDDLKELHTQARTVAYDRPPRPLGHCLEVTCDGSVYWLAAKGAGARCSSCGRPYDGLDLVRLGVAEEASA